MRCAEHVVGHEQILNGLWSAAQSGRLAHALGFFGTTGVGKFLAAERLTQGLLCASGPAAPCGACGPCKRVRADSHADVFVVDPLAEEWETIPIGAITPRQDGPTSTVEQFLALRPLEGGWRIVLVRESHRLNDAAQNALLKTLEEPGENVLLVLETAAPERLLTTVKSRLVPVRFAPLARVDVERVLAAAGVAPAECAQIARWSRGSPGAALAAHERGALGLRRVIEGVLTGEVPRLAAPALAAEVEGRFEGDSPTAQARARARTTLDLVLAVLADLQRAAAGCDPETLAHGDLAALSAVFSTLQIARGLEAALAARQDVDLNLAPDVALLRAFAAFPQARTVRTT